MAEIVVGIGADSSELDKEVALVEKKLERLNKIKDTRIKLGLDTTNVDKEIQTTTTNLNSLNSQLNNTSKSTTSFNTNVKGAGNTLNQFSRIAQDAPFGIMGIGNNITATVEAFTHLQRETGSTGGALKALASSLMGSGGILLAVSLVTTGLTIMSQQGLTVDDVFKKLTGTYDENAKALRELNSEVVANSAKEIATLKANLSIAKDVNLSIDDRTKAVKALKDEYPGLFSNLTNEQILNGKVESAVKGVTSAIIAKAKASAFSSKISELAVEEFELRQKEKKEINDLKRAYASYSNVKGKASAIGGVSGGGGVGAQMALEAQKESLKDIQDAIRANLKTQGLYNEEIRKATVITNSFEANNKAATDAIKERERLAEKARKEAEERVKNAIPITNTLQPDTELVDLSTVETFTGKVDEFGNKIRALPGVISTSLQTIPGVIDSNLIASLETLDKFNTAASEIVSNGIANTFASLGESIGDSLSTGGNILKNAGANLLSSLGKILIDLGKMAISIGVSLLAIKTSLKTLNPFAAIGAGIALIALGKVFSNKSSAIGDSMGSSGGSNYSSGSDYSSPVSSSSSSGYGSGTVVFEISGQSLIGVLSNTLDANSKLGGALTL